MSFAQQCAKSLRVSLVPKSEAKPVHPHVSAWLSPVLYHLGQRLVIPTYFRHVHIQGLEHYPSDGPVLIAPTHRSRWDALILPYTLGYPVTGRHLHFMVSINEMQGLQGWVIQRFGGFAIDPDHPSLRAIRTGIDLLQQGKVLVVFPEGDIFQSVQVQPLKPGFARMALQAQRHCPNQLIHILPVSIAYRPSVPQWGCDVAVTLGPALKVFPYLDLPHKQAAARLSTDLSDTLNHLGWQTPPSLSFADKALTGSGRSLR